MRSVGKRVTKNVALPHREWESFQQWCTEGGRIQTEMVGRVLTWFLMRPEPVQRVIIDKIEEEMRPAYASILRSLADELDGGAKQTGRSAISDRASLEINNH